MVYETETFIKDRKSYFEAEIKIIFETVEDNDYRIIKMYRKIYDGWYNINREDYVFYPQRLEEYENELSLAILLKIEEENEEYWDWEVIKNL